jgi:hypothetical protein
LCGIQNGEIKIKKKTFLLLVVKATQMCNRCFAKSAATVAIAHCFLKFPDWNFGRGTHRHD